MAVVRAYDNPQLVERDSRTLGFAYQHNENRAYLFDLPLEESSKRYFPAGPSATQLGKMLNNPEHYKEVDRNAHFNSDDPAYVHVPELLERYVGRQMMLSFTTLPPSLTALRWEKDHWELDFKLRKSHFTLWRHERSGGWTLKSLHLDRSSQNLPPIDYKEPPPLKKD